MRFLANENFPLSSVHKLREAGLDIVSVIEMMAGAKDERILSHAHQEGQIILTFDRDYGELIYRQKLPVPVGVIYFRFTPLTPEEPAEYILNLLANQKIRLESKFTVARREQIRQRPLPKTTME